ncbi:23S rRNA (guanosine(2251)-2'-O)-methyltransferase RlmB [Puteibacter caeruleilacunae]|nr:23S rRNA (guanosine(2251)-2'-O)-methyltransferase RlmB [Puteibacter caeruleilacunae]
MKKEENFIFGIRAVMEAIESGKEIDKILIRKSLQGDLFNEFFALVRQHELTFQYVPSEKLNKITDKNHQGVIAYVSPITYHSLDQVVFSLLEEKKTPLILVLDRITDVRNFGAIARTAECAGVDAIVIPEQGGARITADAIKTSAGALHHMKVCKEKNLVDVMMLLQQSGFSVVAATEKGHEYYTEADFKGPSAIIMGSEGKGVEKRLLKMSNQLVKIPILGKIDSLNVSVAASIMIYEAVRQRGIMGGENS